jgi:hypothetical protein
MNFTAGFAMKITEPAYLFHASISANTPLAMIQEHRHGEGGDANLSSPLLCCRVRNVGPF